MAHDWSGLLGAIEAYSVRRASSLIDEDEELRRRRSAALRIESQAPEQRFMPTGIASKARRSAVPASGPTIASILQPPQSSQRGVIALVGALGAQRDRDDDDENLRSTGGGGGGGGASSAARLDLPARIVRERSAVEATSRAAIAAGAQPVVIKVTSTVSSRASAAGLMTYLGTREVEKENGEKGKTDIPIYDQDGLAIASREDRAAALETWSANFREAYAVNALATFSINLADVVDDDVLHDALNTAFGSKPFLYSRHLGGKVSVYAVTDLPAKRIASALRAREKAEGPGRAVENAEGDFARRLAEAGVTAEVRILGAAVSEKSGRYFLEKFLRTEKAITTSEGDPVKGGASVKARADGVWQAWSSHIRTVEPRNAFHVIFSARAGTDPEAMKRAVRDFLSEQVAGHRWITAHHPDTGHVHVHAMISARDDVGKALRLTKPELYEWRERFAAKAREHGIAMVATRRADVAATRPYSQAQAGAYERGRSDPRYLKTPTVNNRVERKRAGVVDRASLTSGNLALAPTWQAAASALKRAGAEPSVIAAADRFATAATAQAPQAVARASGFVLLRVEVEQTMERETVAVIVEGALGVEAKSISAEGKSVQVLAPTTASVSKIERELAGQNEEFGPGSESRSVAQSFRARLLAHGLRATVVVEAAGSAKHGAPSPWLQKRFDAVAHATETSAERPFVLSKSVIVTIQQRKEKNMALSLEQFDERVSKANKSMDRLETMVDSSAERQAVEEMRQEISALFAEQRRDIQMQQMRSAADAAGEAGTPPTARAEEPRTQDRAAPTVDPAIADQQQAIATGRATRAAREQAGAAKNAQGEQRQQILRQAEQERQRGNDRDGAER
ncbi:relaxase/mobilization nuclease domain-containing protein [Shinella sumterensis]|uniref:Relaxase/mobilization nuclease domain-containing protein n=1 Tax=Shinella sumterensis TaxID=1967501 RepID=A0AA50CUW9_9HYPH|nr:relaxase/mobilization nuclease domain-containing protein [Shinella sumterensis]WLS01035.1 relaxase/mobilization nuclease domain-containing protein [Shinella sumterensis]WLS11818.1 relaxase/mobilization nuclease domain-containing protein [Shinella sumterensis]